MRLALTGMKRMRNAYKILVEKLKGTTRETLSRDRARLLKSVLKAVK
jgi:hypothetical protein